VIVQTEVKESGRFERTLTVRLENDELAAAKKKAAAKISKSMNIKGFRPGKAPLSVVERMAGADYVRSEAIEEAIQDIVPEAINEAGLDPVTVPTVSAVRDDNEDGVVEIDVLVTLWPVLESLPEFGEIEIEVEDPTPTDDEIEEQLDALRNQFAELADHDGDLAEGDFALIDISAEIEGEPVDTAGAKDLMYELGTNSFIPGLDEILVGATVGDTVTGSGTLPEGYSERGGEDVDLIVTIKEAKKKVLPELTDEMVIDSTEFETVVELREAIEKNMLAYKVHNQRAILQDKIVEYISNEVDFEVPAALIDAEVEARVRNLAARLEEDKIDLQNYLRITGQDEATFIASLRDQANSALSTRVLLDSIAAIENYEVSDEEILEYVTEMFQGQIDDPQVIVDSWAASGQIESLVGDILRERAITGLVESAKPVDADGNPVDLTPVVIEQREEETEDDSTDEVEEAPEASDDDVIKETEQPEETE
ncbi:MAG: trigger factor, partial [Actinomycetia bacterium]|nr:trigger factor [Actinomycetes bacterium]